MSSRNGTAPAGMTVCSSSGPAVAQATVMKGFTVNITFPGTPPFRLTASNGTTICPSHSQNLTSNTFSWIVDTSTNATTLRSTTGELSGSPGRTLDPVFQLGDGVQWVAHEWTSQSNGQFRYFLSSVNYTVTSEERSLAEQTATRSAGLRVAEVGAIGWLIGALLLAGAMATSV